MLDIPLYVSHGNRCGQAVIKSILKVFKPEEKFSWKELEGLTDFNESKFTYTCQIANAFYKLGIPFKYFMMPGAADLIRSGLLPEKIRDTYRENAEEIIRRTDFLALERSINALFGSNSLVEIATRPKVMDLEEMMCSNKVPICLIDCDIAVGKPTRRKGHFIILRDANETEIEYQDCGPINPTKRRKMPCRAFLRSWSLCFFDHNLIVVGG